MLVHVNCTGHANTLGEGVGVADAVMDGVNDGVMEADGVLLPDGATLGVMVGVLVTDGENCAVTHTPASSTAASARCGAMLRGRGGGGGVRLRESRALLRPNGPHVARRDGRTAFHRNGVPTASQAHWSARFRGETAGRSGWRR